MTDVLKETFPQYKICDISHLEPKQVFSVSNYMRQVSKNKNKNIVFMNKNTTNEHLFEYYEYKFKEKIKDEDINKLFNIIVYYKQYTRFFKDMNDLLTNIASLKRMITDDVDCPICLEVNNSFKGMCCPTCGVHIHIECFKEYIKKSDNTYCPICREDLFSKIHNS